MSCSFCTDKHKDLEIIETEFWKIQVPSNQSYLGYCTVILKRHAGDLAELTPAEWNDFSETLAHLERALRAAFDPTLFNWSCLMNLAFQNDPPNPHVHWHVKPRYGVPVIFADQTFVDEEFGLHYDPKKANTVSPEVHTAIKEKIVTAWNTINNRIFLFRA